MKKLLRFFALLCIFVIMLSLALPVGADLAPSITINYQPGSCCFDFYKVADVNEENGMTLAPPFDVYVNTSSTIGEIDFSDTDDLRILATTLEALVVRDGITPTYTAETDSEGTLVLNDVELGVYLIVGEKTSKGKYVYTPSPIFVSVPNGYGEYENLQYNITVDHSKYEKEALCGQCTEYKVMKLWCDDGCNDKRPESISVELLRNGEIYDTVELSAENDWSYVWKGLSAECDWVAVEKTVPEDYSMTVEKNGDLFVIRNTYEGPPPPPAEELPQTGQLWWPVPVMLLLGLTSFIVGWLQRKYL